MRYTLISLFLLATLYTYSQNVTSSSGTEAQENLRELASMSGTGNVTTFDNRYQGVKGSPFIYEDWKAGEIYTTKNERVFFNDMNYNCFDDEIAYIEPASNRTMVINRFVVDFFIIYAADDTITFVPIKLSEKSQEVFAQLMYNKKSKVYKVYGKEFVRASYEGGYSANRPYDEFVDKSDLYFMKHDEKVLYKVKGSKKYMIAAFPDHKDAISKFIKANGLKFKEDSDVIALLTYFDGL
jgi:hypothetical protein